MTTLSDQSVLTIAQTTSEHNMGKGPTVIS